MANSALLVMDVQVGIVGNLGERADDFVTTVQSAVDAAHQAHMLVIFVVVRFRPGYPEMSPRNKMFARLRKKSQTNMDETTAATQPIISLQENDLLVTKRRVSAFAGSDLEVMLRSQGITHLVLSGISTSGVVLSTLREAADKDFQITVLADACVDHDDEVQRVLTEKVFPRQAEVTSVADWTTSLATENND